MKLPRYYILSIIIVMLTTMSFDISSTKLMDNTLETKIEVSLEEEKESKQTSDENLIANTPEFDLKEIKVLAGFDSSIPLVNQLYPNNIYKPPIFS